MTIRCGNIRERFEAKVKVIIVTQDEPFYMPVFFKHFFKICIEKKLDTEVIGVVVQRPLGQRSKITLVRRMIDLYGTIPFVVQGLNYSLLKIEEKLSSLGIVLTGSSLVHIFTTNNISLLRYKNVNSDAFIHFVKDHDVDLIISVAASQIFKPEILKAPKKGCINIHNAPLPHYRGMMPTFWQMYHGEEYAVTTIHEMVEELDSGRIISQDKTKIAKGITLDRLIKITKKRSADALIKVLEMYIKNNVKLTALSDEQGSYFSFPTKRDVYEFRARGYRVI